MKISNTILNSKISYIFIYSSPATITLKY